jgi:hypothetical protein
MGVYFGIEMKPTRRNGTKGETSQSLQFLKAFEVTHDEYVKHILRNCL